MKTYLSLASRVNGEAESIPQPPGVASPIIKSVSVSMGSCFTSISLMNSTFTVQCSRSRVRRYMPASSTLHLLSGPVVKTKSPLSTPLLLILQSAEAGRMNGTSQLPFSMQAFISPAFSSPSYSKMYFDFFTSSVGLLLSQPLGVASPSIYTASASRGSITGASFSPRNSVDIVQLRKSKVRRYLPAYVTRHLLSGSPACIVNFWSVMSVFDISVPPTSGRMKGASKLPVVRQSFISPLYNDPSHEKTSASSAEASSGVGLSMFQPFGVASPTIKREEVLIGRSPSMITGSFSSSQPIRHKAMRVAARPENIFFNFIIVVINNVILTP